MKELGEFLWSTKEHGRFDEFRTKTQIFLSLES